MANRAQRVRRYLIHKPHGQLSQRVQAAGPEHFGVLCFDCAKARSKFMLANFYGTVLLEPQKVEHTRGQLRATLDQVRQALNQHGLRDLPAVRQHGHVCRGDKRDGLRAGDDVHERVVCAEHGLRPRGHRAQLRLLVDRGARVQRQRGEAEAHLQRGCVGEQRPVRGERQLQLSHRRVRADPAGL